LKKYYNVKSYANIPDVQELPSLIDIQLESFARFIANGLTELFGEVSPIESHDGNLRLFFPSDQPESQQFDLKYWFEEPKYDIDASMERDISYAAPLYVRVALVNREIGDSVVIQDIFMGDFPLMTPKGTFIINGTERVVVSQLIRSPGVYFDAEEDRSTGRQLATAKLMPDRGAWMEFETKKTDYIAIKFNRKRTLPVTMFLRALAAIHDNLPPEVSPLRTGEDEELLQLFADVDNHEVHHYIASSIEQEPTYELKKGQTIADAALIEFYRRMRPGEPPTLDNAREFLEGQLFDRRRYDLERVGRYKLNQRLGLGDIIPQSERTITKNDIVRIIERMIMINNGQANRDDIDHLGNRRVKTVGELITGKLRLGLRRMERVIRERMSIRDNDNLTPINLVNIRPMVAAIREFFGSSQLSQFMEQTNPLAELTHKRTVSALGPGGLRRERAGFDVRDVHHSHYGRICPIETPEGPNIGLIGRLASYARVNEFGFVETPYRPVVKFMAVTDPDLIGRTLREDVEGAKGKVIATEGAVVDEALVSALSKARVERVSVRPFVVSNEIIYMSADDEDKFIIAQANSLLNERGEFINERLSARYEQSFLVTPAQRADYMDVAPRQIVGISAALIPFLSHDDANRALMGSNMQRQAVPLINPDVSKISTGMEAQAAYDSGQVLIADVSGEVISVQGDRIIMRLDEDGSERAYPLRKFDRSNQSTCIDQRPTVYKGQTVNAGDVLADSSSTINGYLALGHDVRAAFLSWLGGNYEDALLISEEMLRTDMFTSIHIEKFEIEARDTKLGPEEITYDIPNVGEEALKDLDEFGIIRIGADVNPNDILVGKITPKGEKELSPEEKLLRAIFGEQSREVKDSSLRLPHGDRGKIVDVRVFTREEHPDLQAGVDKMVRVSVAQRRKLTVGDKMAGRHGNKGVISRIVPIEDMPYLEDGTPVQIILNPLGVPGRMNIGQVLELHTGWAADRLGFRAVTPVFDGASEREIRADLGRAWLIDYAEAVITERAWAWVNEYLDSETLEDDDEVRRLYAHAWLSQDPSYNGQELLEEPIYARRAILAEWLRERGYDPAEVLIFDNTGYTLTERERIDDNAIRVSLLEWIHYVQPELVVPDANSIDDLFRVAEQVEFETGEPVPHYGKHKLYDGRTGELFDRSVAVGYVHMLKLAHLVEDKAHARSTGPYSLVTQQPLGGKAQFGGQRFGEMEVWALEAYGAAYTLQEMLTVKSDDVQGRVKTYESIVKGEPIEEPGIPTSFRVLVKEMQSLGLAVEAITTSGDVLEFGKDDESLRRPNPDYAMFNEARR
jgi:DNA-directed RNA polymerase subunit beta